MNRNLWKWISIPGAFMFIWLGALGSLIWFEESFKSCIVGNALEGNEAAILLLQKYEKPWKLSPNLVKSAMKGNEYAIQALGLKEK